MALSGPSGQEGVTGADSATEPLLHALNSLLRMSEIQQTQQETVARLLAEVQRQGEGLIDVSSLARIFEDQAAGLGPLVQDYSRQLAQFADTLRAQTEGLERQEQGLQAAVLSLHSEVETLRRQTQADEWEQALAAAQERADVASQRADLATQQVSNLGEQLKLKEQELAQTLVQALQDREQDRDRTSVLQAEILQVRGQLAEREDALSEAAERLSRAEQRANTLATELAEVRKRVAQIALLTGHVGEEDRVGTVDPT